MNFTPPPTYLSPFNRNAAIWHSLFSVYMYLHGFLRNPFYFSQQCCRLQHVAFAKRHYLFPISFIRFFNL